MHLPAAYLHKNDGRLLALNRLRQSNPRVSALSPDSVPCNNMATNVRVPF
jgi:hypothetical protein